MLHLGALREGCDFMLHLGALREGVVLCYI